MLSDKRCANPGIAPGSVFRLQTTTCRACRYRATPGPGGVPDSISGLAPRRTASPTTAKSGAIFEQAPHAVAHQFVIVSDHATNAFRLLPAVKMCSWWSTPDKLLASFDEVRDAMRHLDPGGLQSLHCLLYLHHPAFALANQARTDASFRFIYNACFTCCVTSPPENRTAKRWSRFLSGLPAGLAVDQAFVDRELWRRQQGYGRGGRMKIETDRAHFFSGVHHGKTIGSPIAVLLQIATGRIGKSLCRWRRAIRKNTSGSPRPVPDMRIWREL